jgi:hypothetical protein
MTEIIRSDFDTVGHTKGAWFTTADGIIHACVQQDNTVYAGVFVGDPTKTHQLPYALSFSNGELILQNPIEGKQTDPLILKMKDVEAMAATWKGKP